ncbi:hypothetical protein ABK040_014982 [Willaertia magna]
MISDNDPNTPSTSTGIPNNNNNPFQTITSSTNTTLNNNNSIENNSIQKITDKSETHRTITYFNVQRLATDFSFLVDNSELSDVQFRVGQQKKIYHCHKVILCQRSEYFRNMFLVHKGMFLESSLQSLNNSNNITTTATATGTNTTSDNNNNNTILVNSLGYPISIVEKPNISPAVFEKVLYYIYTGKITFTTKLKQRKIKDKTLQVVDLIGVDDLDNVISMCMHVLAAADELILPELKSFCIDYVKQYIDSESAIVLLDLALKYGSDDLVDSCFDFIKHNAKEVIASESLPYVSKETIKLFLESEFLAVDEIEIFRCLLRWGLAEMESIQEENQLYNTSDDISDSSDLLLDENVNESNHESFEEEELKDDIDNKERKEEINNNIINNNLNNNNINNNNNVINNKGFKEILKEGPSDDEEEIFKRKSKAITRKRMMIKDYLTSSETDSDNDLTDLSSLNSLRVVRNPLHDDASIYTKYFLDAVPLNRHHTDLIQLSNKLTDEDKVLLKQVVLDLIPCIRYPLMTPHQLTDIVETFKIVDDSFLLEAYKFICAGDRTNSSSSSNGNGNGSGNNNNYNTKRLQKRKGGTDGDQLHFANSSILKSKFKLILLKWCGEQQVTKGKIWTLGFKATKDGFDSNTFHQRCDHKGPTILVCRTSEGYIFGGYNSMEWNSNNQWLKASDTFLFSLVNPYNDGPRKLKVKNPQRAIYCHSSSGPSFGGGTNLVFDPYDLYLDSSLKRGHCNVGGAYSTFRGGFRSDEAQKSLAGSLNNWILNEVEVFMLQ